MTKFSPLSLMLGAAFVISTVAANAAIDKVPRSLDDFQNYPMETTTNVRVPTATVVLADYDLIARDFPEQQKSPTESEGEWKARVDKWLVSDTGFILEAQAKQQVVNSPIPVDNGVRKEAFRPTSYGRAHLIPVRGGMMDAKGVGSKTPSHASHGNGLATLGEMIREFILEKTVSEIFGHEKVAKTVACYAVVDYGFDVIHEDGSRSRAGYVLRQAHQRSSEFNSSLTKAKSFLVEKVLRKFGLTSSDETYVARHRASLGLGRNYDFDYTNIQGTNNQETIEVIDFGAYRAVERFEYRLVSNSNFEPLMDVNDPGFVQPDSKLRVSMEQWAQVVSGPISIDKVYVRALDLAKGLGKGAANGRQAIEAFAHSVIAPIKEKLQRYRYGGSLPPGHERAQSCSALFR